jgi:prenyltransferase beta subunit
MKQAFVISCLLWASVGPALCQAPTAQEKQTTVAWLTRIQQSNGGFAADDNKATPPTLPATISAVRALKYFGSPPPQPVEIVRFLQSCWNENQGGFAPTPGGKVDVRTTAVAVMGLFDLGAADQNQEMIAKGMAYLGANAKDYEDVRIAAAALEATKKPAPQIQKWRDILHAMPASTDAKQARETGGVVVALLRLGESVENKDAVLKALRAGQGPAGAWGKPGAGADLESSYRVMRAFYMLKAKPNVEALRKFIAQCRQADGSYAVAPGQKASVSAVYYAGIISYWLDWLQEHGEPS